jgi:hypothetical protein
VEECRHITSKQPKDEPCRFCNNVCNSWKKLTVHMAKHMEQIAMPVLELVKERAVSADTIISPMERVGFPAHPQSSTRSPVVSPLPASGTCASNVPAYPPSLPVNHGATNGVGPAPFYGTGPQNTEPYGVSHTPMLSDQLRVHSELAGRSQGPDSVAVAATTTPYTSLSPYPVSSSPPNRGHNAYSSTQVQQSFAPNHNSATYPPPYNAVPRQTRVAVPTPQQIPATRPQYGLDVDNQPPLYGSPVENVIYLYQQSGLPYAPTSGGMEYPTIPGQDDGPTGQQSGYLQPGTTQYSYPNQ